MPARLAALLALSLAVGCTLNSALELPERPDRPAPKDAATSSGAPTDASTARADASGIRDAGMDAARLDAARHDTAPSPRADAAGAETDAGDDDADVDVQPDAQIDAAVDAGVAEPAACELGLAEVTTYRWLPYLPSDPIPLTGAGQSSLLIEVALRMRGPPIPATVDVVVTALDSGREERTVRPDEDMFSCDANDVCDFSPMFLRTFNLVDNPYLLDYLEVAIDAEVSTADGVFCTASMQGYLLRRI